MSLLIVMVKCHAELHFPQEFVSTMEEQIALFLGVRPI